MPTLKKIRTLATDVKKSPNIVSDFVFSSLGIDEYQTNKTYYIGDRIVQLNYATGKYEVLICLENGVTGTFNASKWKKDGLFENFASTVNLLRNKDAEYVRSATKHSGFTKLGKITYTTEPNKIILGESEAVIRGRVIKIPDNTPIVLDPAPTFGYREDLVFLEQWFTEKKPGDPIYKDGNVNSTIERYASVPEIVEEWRIRVVSNADFNKLQDGFVNKDSAGWGHTPILSNVTPQGLNASPLSYDPTNPTTRVSTTFRKANGADLNYRISDDVGLYVSGDGTQTAKNILKTADGYVYAIPMFRIKRRNNAGYRADNLNGARDYFTFNLTITGQNVYPQETRQVTVTADEYSKINVGDSFRLVSNPNLFSYPLITVLSKDGNNQITIKNNAPVSVGSGVTLGATNPYFIDSGRPDGKYANIIDKDDIIEDLRHKVSLTGFNYQHLLEGNFDKFMRSELQTKVKPTMKKERFNLVPAPLGLKQDLVPISIVGNDGVARDLVNLFGAEGNFENNSTMFSNIIGSGGTRTIVSGTSKYGTKSLKLDRNGATGYIGTKARIEKYLKQGSYYLVRSSILNQGSLPLTFQVVLNGGEYEVGAPSSRSKSASTSTDFKDYFLKFQYNGEPSVSLSWVWFDSTSTVAYIDGVAIYEIDQATYDKIDTDPEFTGDKLMQKFPYVDSFPNFVENLLSPKNWIGGRWFDNGFIPNSWSVPYDGGLIIDLTSGGTSAMVTQKVTVKKNTTYTLSAKGAGNLYVYDKNNAELIPPVTNTGGSTYIVATFNTGNNDFITVGVYHPSTMTNKVFDEVMLVEGFTRQPFVPYGRWFLPYDYANGQVSTNFTRVNDHRGVVSDAQTSVLKTDIVEPLKTPQSHIKVTQTTEGQWSAGDTIQITSNEGVITGVYDSDTALALFKGVGGQTYNAGTPIPVDDVSKIAVNDKVKIVSWSTMISYPTNGDYTVTAVDSTNKTITLDQSVTPQFGDFFVETTASTSTPVVTATGIAGTWSGLGTKQATFTISTPPTNNTNPIKIDYSISYPAGLGICEVPSEVLEASVNGQRLVKASDNIVRVKANFEGKVTGSTDLVSHVAKNNGNQGQTSLINPSSFSTEFNTGYSTISKLDGTTVNITNSTNGAIAQVLFSFDLIRLMEDKFGHGFFADCVTTADKVNKLKSVITEVTCSWWGYGINPNGNKAYIKRWIPRDGSWFGSTEHTSGTVTKISTGTTTFGAEHDGATGNDGWFHVLVYTDPSDGVTASTIYTDYVELEVKLNVAESGYDVLIPENPFPKLNENLLPFNRAFPIDPNTADFLEGTITDFQLEITEQGTVKVKRFQNTTSAHANFFVNTINTITSGEVVSGSFEVMSSVDRTLTFSIQQMGNSEQGNWKSVAKTVTLKSGKWEKVVIEGLIVSGGNYQVRIGLGSGQLSSFSIGQEISFRKLMIQKGLPIKNWKQGTKKKTIFNFLGKVAGRTFENPHRAFARTANIVGINVSNDYVEISQTNYDNISKQDGVLYTESIATTGSYAQQLFEFDLSHLGLSLSELKKALRKITVTWVGYGKGDNAGAVSYGAVLKGWWAKQGVWATSNEDIYSTNTSSSPSTIVDNTSNHEYITNDQKVYILVHSTYPAGSSSWSEIHTDYIKLEVELADYVDYVKSNVVKIRKETKEMKLQYPAKSYRSGVLDSIELFYNYIPQYPRIEANTDVTILAELDGFLVSDLGSAVGHKQGTHHYKNPLYRVANDRTDTFGEFGFGRVPFAADSKGVNIGAKVTVNGTGFYDYFTKQYGLTVIKKPLVAIGSWLVLHNGELKMLVVSYYSNNGLIETNNSGIALLIPIEGRPLANVEEGVQRAAITPTAWKTPTGEIMGYLNENGEIIVTYQ
jgi:hypothetical protein